MYVNYCCACFVIVKGQFKYTSLESELESEYSVKFKTEYI